MRCPQCRLVIGAGRALELSDDADPGPSRGTAAGFVASAARREECAPGDSAEIGAALRGVSAVLGCDVRRLRMLDYELARDADESLPSLGVVIATHGSWKNARAAAGSQHAG